MDLQYINSSCHRELLQIIVDSHRKTLANTIKESFASSLRCDGSVDRTQVDKIFTMLKIIDKDAHEQLLFVGAKEPKETGDAGCLNTLKGSCTELEAGMNFSILQEVSSVVTDGTNRISGEWGGLRVLLQKLRQQQVPEKEILMFHLLKYGALCTTGTLHGNQLLTL